jgi:hypothetical protein
MASNSKRYNFKHSCGFEFSIKVNGKTTKRECPKCHKIIDITNLRIYKTQ